MNQTDRNERRQSSSASTSFSRRRLLTGATALGMATALPRTAEAAKSKKNGVQKGRIDQSIVNWCFQDHWSLEETCRTAEKLGCKSVELVGPEDWSMLRKYDLVCAITPSHLFVRGMNNPKHWDECLSKMRQAIDATAEAGFGNVITFTGYGDTTEEGGSKIDPEKGARNCIEGYKKIVGYAENKKVTLALEMLNTRADDHPMKGHPGYQGDHTDYCIDIIKRVGSPRLKLLFDIYHVQIMDGDVIRRIRQIGEYIAHVHTAGNPGRGELDDKQEINYPPIMEALLEIGYDGFVGQEFIPTRDPFEGLKQAVELCDV